MEFPENLTEKLKTSKKICILTGAGISAESGVPTFRDKEGFWAKLKPEELANLDAFMKNPTLVWEWYSHRKRVLQGVTPNPGHHALVEMQKLCEEWTLVTQNVDGLHQRAGSLGVLEVHGNIERSFCIACGEFAADILLDEKSKKLPRCEKCGDLLRPDVVWFGENLPVKILNQSMDAARNCDLFFSIGTSTIVYPAAALPFIAHDSGAYVVEVNPQTTDLSRVADCVLTGKAGEIMPEVVKHWKSL